MFFPQNAVYLLKCNYFLSFDYHNAPPPRIPGGSILHVRIQCLANNLRPQHVHIISCVPFARICEAHTKLSQRVSYVKSKPPSSVCPFDDVDATQATGRAHAIFTQLRVYCIWHHGSK